MDQLDMSWEVFLSLIDKLKPHTKVSLQGEGEPTLWPHFYRAAELLHSRQIPVTSIINASRVDVDKLVRYFTNIGVSLDTLDNSVAASIGRHNLPKALRNVELLITAMRSRLTVHTVDLGQDLKDLKEYCQKHKLRHVIQPLQAKADYVVVYPKTLKPKTGFFNRQMSYVCGYLEVNKMDFYTVQGQHKPCCFMKTPMTMTSAQLRDSLKQGDIPYCCLGCRNLIARPAVVGSRGT